MTQESGRIWVMGGRPLNGTAAVPAAKNSVLPLLAATLLCRGDYISCRELPAEIAGVSGAVAVPLRNPAGEEEQIRRALALAGGNKSQAAKLLGIDRKTLYNKLHLYGIE